MTASAVIDRAIAASVRTLRVFRELADGQLFWAPVRSPKFSRRPRRVAEDRVSSVAPEEVGCVRGTVRLSTAVGS
jgi:hypothetical protein